MPLYKETLNRDGTFRTLRRQRSFRTFALYLLFASVLNQAYAGPVYTVNRSISGGGVTGYVETDGTIGVLAANNIIDWQLLLNDATGTFTLLGPNSGDNSELSIVGSAFIATATDLLFDFSGAGGQNVLFQNPNLGSAMNFWCFDTIVANQSFCSNSTADESVGVAFQNFLAVERSGLISIAMTTIPPAAVLPAGRSVQTGSAATVFATMINTGAITATGCAISPISSIPATFLYQTTDPATNALVGSPDTPVDIPAGGTQSFMISFTPSAPFAPTDVQLDFSCSNTESAAVVPGLNTLLLSASSGPVADIVALALTASGDGVVSLPGSASAGAFAVATVNVGSQDTITAIPDTGSASLPLNLQICETNPADGQCLAAPAASVTTTINNNATPTFAVFVTATGSVPFDPAINRIFVRFQDAGAVVRGATSVAVETQ